MILPFSLLPQDPSELPIFSSLKEPSQLNVLTLKLCVQLTNASDSAATEIIVSLSITLLLLISIVFAKANPVVITVNNSHKINFFIMFIFYFVKHSKTKKKLSNQVL